MIGGGSRVFVLGSLGVRLSDCRSVTGVGGFEFCAVVMLLLLLLTLSDHLRRNLTKSVAHLGDGGSKQSRKVLEEAKPSSGALASI